MSKRHLRIGTVVSPADDCIQHDNHGDYYRGSLKIDSFMLPCLRQSMPAQTTFRRSVDWNSYNPLHRKNSAQKLQDLKMTLSSLSDKIARVMCELREPDHVIYQATESSISKTNTLSFSNQQRSQSQLIGKCQDNEWWRVVKQQKVIINSQYYLNRVKEAIEGDNPQAYEHILLSMRAFSHVGAETMFVNKRDQLRAQQMKIILLRRHKDIAKKTLFFEIEGALTHSSEHNHYPYDIKLDIKTESRSKHIYVSIRPYAVSFLRKMAHLFELVSFTTLPQYHANAILDELDPNRQWIAHRLDRRHCTLMQNNHYCKDLRMVDRSLSQCVLVDTVPYAYTLQIDNGVPLLPYTSGDDKTLLELEKYLQMLTECSDVRVVNKEVFKLSSYCKFVSPKQLVTTLYRDYLI